MCYTIVTEREGKPSKPERTRTMANIMRIEYGTEKNPMVYIVDGERNDIVAMPILFYENRFVMAKEAWALVTRK